MARGPYEGTWQQGVRPTVVSAPDALVYINGEIDVIGCAQCKRRFDLNKYITSVQVDLNIDSAPGSASISLAIPRHSVDEFYYEGNPLVTPMMEVEIFAKGYFLVEGVPQYYPIFWGLISEVTDNYAGGEHTVNINCADILKWWELCRMNVNPAFTQPNGQAGRSIFGNVFFGSNPYDLIWTLAQQSFGDIVVGSGSLVSLYKEGQQKQTFNQALGDIMAYWNSRFTKIRSNLLLYGTQGNAVRGDLLYDQYRKQGGNRKFKSGTASHFASKAVRAANGGSEGSQMVYDPTDSNVVAFRTQFMQAGQVNFWQSEYQTKLELANAAKEAIGYEFYMDVTGDIVFKPPFYNLDILSNKPVSWIQDIDIIDWNLSESEAEVVTQVQIQGSYAGNVDYGFGEEVTPFTSVTDYHLLRKYGWRPQTFNSEFLGSPLLMFYMGLDLLDRYNARRFRGTVNIPFRPELRLGFPVYLASKDQVWYVSGISHNIQFGGRAQTTLSLIAKRSKFTAPKGIGTIELTGFAPTSSSKSQQKVGKKGAKTQKTTPLKPAPENPTAKQLRDNGRFKVKVGDAAQLPPSNYPTSPGADNPYAPLILRHPKTGRQVGYPNVVMAYTRPFQPPPDTLANLKGQKKSSEGRVVKQFLNQIDKAGKKAIEAYDEEAHTATKEDALREKFLNNRYSYGLNSAGVYTYLHDVSHVIKEMVILPAHNISYDAETDKARFQGQSGMIRPVSDERGFEVIGHYKYGRNVSLTDGSLALNGTEENPAAKNSRVDVQQPLTLSGNLYETLQAQSAGITVSSTVNPNPAKAITTLAPEELQTAGIMTPEGPAYSNPGANFVDVAPLGTPEQKGSVNQKNAAAVEASQLSRALTLTEMSVREESLSEEDCDCLLSRSDLNFINVGYQVRVLRAAGSDDSSVSFGSVSSDAGDPALAKEIQDRINAQTQAKLDALDADAIGAGLADPSTGKVDLSTEEAKAKVILEAQQKLQEEYAANGIDAGLMAEALDEGKPVADVSVLSRSSVMNKVESFLAGLYKALDDSHQEVEKALRGEYLEDSGPAPSDVRFGQESTLSDVAPPFSPGGRALGGDPEALALQGTTATADLAATWNEFAGKLKANTEKAQVSAEVDRLKKKLSDVPEDGEERNQLVQDLANAQQKLNNLNQKYPDAPFEGRG